MPKFDYLTLSVSIYHPHIICIVETWLSNEITSAEIDIPGYQLYRKDRNRQGGGILIYVVNCMLVSLFPDSGPHLELLTLTARLNNFKLTLCLFYRPPSSGSYIFDLLISYFESNCTGSLSNLIFLGDFNVNYSNVSHPLYHTLYSFVSLYNLSQHVSGPTRVHENSSSTIDLLFSNEVSLVHRCETIPPLSTSDHYGIVTTINKKFRKHRVTNKGRKIWRYLYANWDGACEAIDDFDWDSIMSDDIDVACENWLNQFMQIMDQYIPNCSLKSRHNLPWLSKPLVRSIRKKNLLFKRAKSSGNFRKYKVHRNRTLANLRAAKRAYFQKLNPRDPKSFWKAIKFLSKSPHLSVPTLIQGDTTATTDFDKANLLNSFFHSCFNTSQPPIASLHAHSTESLEDNLCTEAEVFDLLSSLDTTKSSGPDGVSAKMLKFTATSITPSVTKLFNLSISKCRVPSMWKKSAIVPIPKAKDTSAPSNYRPISLLPLLSKLLEKHIYGLISQHLQFHNFFSDSQWGFTEGRSTVTALIKCVDDWLKVLEEGKEICAVFFDYRKAFDTVPHQPLIAKLRTLDLDHSIVYWLHDYLCDRTQSVVVGGESSDLLPVLSGVPQGSVLGPLLFLIYINDLPGIVLNFTSRINLFADDVLLYHVITSAADYSILQDMICRIEQWSSTNYLYLHPSKCKYMTVSRKKSPSLPTEPLQLLGSELERVDCYRYLGVLLTSDLSWSPHVTNICTKARRVLGLLYRRFYGSTSQESLKQLYLSLVRPHMEYACQVWDPHLAGDKKAIECVQKFALKLATAKWDKSYDELLDLADLKPLEDRRVELKLGLLYKILNDLCFFPDGPLKFRNHWSSRTAHHKQLSIPFAHSNSYFYSFFPHTSSIWNTLDSKCVSSNSYSCFMHNLRC